jgi:hypothetical protein
MGSELDFPLAPWGKGIWIITVLSVGVLIVLAGAFLYRGVANGPESGGSALYFVLSGALVVLILLLLVFAPRKYVVTPTSLVVSRLGPKVRIGFEQIESVELLADRSMLHGVIRVMGVGGVFGCYGLFCNWKSGTFRAYVTRTEGLVLIRRKKGDPVLLSPCDPAGFVEQVQKQMNKEMMRPLIHGLRE